MVARCECKDGADGHENNSTGVNFTRLFFVSRDFC
jgi:hypothetical protein